MPSITFQSRSESDTRCLGRALAECLPARSCVALIGTLGAGKTRLVQATAAACGIDPASVTSPTFVICQNYRGRRTIFHMDAYRLHDLDEFFELGADEYFETCDLSFVEWADRVREGLPDTIYTVTIDITGPTSRRVTISADGDRAGPVIERLRTAYEDALARTIHEVRREKS